MNDNATPPPADQVEELEEDTQLEELRAQLFQAQEAEKRAMADYRNLSRRTQEDRIRIVKLAGREVIERLLQPLEHLFLAKEQLKDPGLEMVYQQFQQALRGEGLEEIEVLGKEVDPHVMEVVGKEPVTDKKQIGKVVKVTGRGYRLNGEVIQPAKVIVGAESN